MSRQRLIGCSGVTRLFAAVLLAASSTVALAGPPPWAPAWGYRGHHGHYAPAPVHQRHEHHHYHHYSPPRRSHGASYGHPAYRAPAPARHGRGRPAHCGEPLFAGALGGALGGFAGSKIGRGDGQLAATAAGTLLGYSLGRNVGGRCSY